MICNNGGENKNMTTDQIPASADVLFSTPYGWRDRNSFFVSESRTCQFGGMIQIQRFDFSQIQRRMQLDREWPVVIFVGNCIGRSA